MEQGVCGGGVQLVCGSVIEGSWVPFPSLRGRKGNGFRFGMICDDGRNGARRKMAKSSVIEVAKPKNGEKRDITVGAEIVPPPKTSTPLFFYASPLSLSSARFLAWPPCSRRMRRILRQCPPLQSTGGRASKLPPNCAQ